VTEIGSALKGRGRRSLALLREATVTPIVVEHRDRLARLGAEEVEAALAARAMAPSGREVMRRCSVPDGRLLPASWFALDPTPGPWQATRRQWGGRRSASNRAVRTPEAGVDAYREAGTSAEPPSFSGLRWRWNRAKATECADRKTGEVWWPQISKKSFADGIRDAVESS